MSHSTHSRHQRLAAFSALAFLMLLLALPRLAAAQLVLDADYAPNINGDVWATALQADGKVLIGGSFTSVNSTSRPRIARMNVDGSLDTGFASGLAVDGDVYSVIALPDGKVLIGGDFTLVGGQTRHGVARLNSNGTVDSSFVPPTMTADADGRRVLRLLRLAEGANAGKILVAGRFLDIGPSPTRAKIARLNEDGSLDTGFQALAFDAAASIQTMAEQFDGPLVIGGQFAAVDGQPHQNLARLSSEGVLDAGFNIGVTHSTAPSIVHRIIVQPGGKLVVAGDFIMAVDNSGGIVGGARRLARFNADLTVDADFTHTTGANGAIRWMEMQIDGKLLIGGNFAQVYNGGTSAPHSRLARINLDGTPDSSFAPPTINNNILSLIQQADGRVVVGGSFTSVDGTTRNRLARVVPMQGVTAISAGDGHTCAIHNGAAKCWGRNLSGQLGNNSTTVSAMPVQVQGLGSGVTAISAGWFHTCAVHNGAAKCWGRNWNGQLGNNSTTNSSTPVQVQGLTSGVTAISVRRNYTCAIHNGAAKCWGYNSLGQLGNNSTTDSATPVQVQGLDSGVTAISTSMSHTCAIHNGAAKCWGSNGYGQLGNNSPTNSSIPVQVQGLDSGVTAISSAGDFHACAIHNGAAKCWGHNQYGQLGNNSTTNSAMPVQVQGLGSGVTAISSGSYHTCATHNGAAKCWGYNWYGRLGNNSTTDSSTPVQVEGLISGVTAISAGYAHTCAIHNGAAKCWGRNSAGQLGDGTTTDRHTPVLVLLELAPLPPPVAPVYNINPTVSGGNGSISPATPQAVAYNHRTSFTLSPAAGHHVNAITGSCGGTLAGNVFTIAPAWQSCNVIASFAINQYDITASAPGGNGSITATTAQVSHGGMASFTVVPAPGYIVQSISGDTCTPQAAGGTLWQAASIMADCHVTASFMLNSHTVTPDVSGGHGAISPHLPQSIQHADTTTFTLQPEAGYRVADVTGSCGGTRDDLVFTTAPVMADCSVIASFMRNPNSAPVLAILGQQAHAAGSVGVQVVPGFASVISFGDAPWEVEQDVLGFDVEVLADSAGVLFGTPTLAGDGALSFVLSGESGSAQLRVRVRDDGGTADGGVDASDWQNFSITVGEGLDVAVRITSAQPLSELCRFGDYTVVVENVGTVAASTVQVDIPLPDSVPEATWTCVATGSASGPPSGSGAIHHSINLPRNSGVFYRLTGLFSPGPDPYDVFLAQASISGDVFPDNNEATAPATVCLFSDGYEGEGEGEVEE